MFVRKILVKKLGGQIGDYFMARMILAPLIRTYSPCVIDYAVSGVDAVDAVAVGNPFVSDVMEFDRMNNADLARYDIIFEISSVDWVRQLAEAPFITLHPAEMMLDHCGIAPDATKSL